MLFFCNFFFFKQKTAYEMRISDWSSDVCFRSPFRQLLFEALGIGSQFRLLRLCAGGFRLLPCLCNLLVQRMLLVNTCIIGSFLPLVGDYIIRIVAVKQSLVRLLCQRLLYSNDPNDIITYQDRKSTRLNSSH